jgi:hypothetical protein
METASIYWLEWNLMHNDRSSDLHAGSLHPYPGLWSSCVLSYFNWDECVTVCRNETRQINRPLALGTPSRGPEFKFISLYIVLSIHLT